MVSRSTQTSQMSGLRASISRGRISLQYRHSAGAWSSIMISGFGRNAMVVRKLLAIRHRRALRVDAEMTFAHPLSRTLRRVSAFENACFLRRMTEHAAIDAIMVGPTQRILQVLPASIVHG